MKPSEIQVGKTYTNRGAGRTRRTVLAIGDEYRPHEFFSDSDPPDEPGVMFEQKGRGQHSLYLSSFAAWAGREA